LSAATKACLGVWIAGVALLACGSAVPACAQDSTAVARDSAAVAPAPPAPATGRVTSKVRTSEERDRFEFGAGVVKGFFDANGTFAYRRFLSERHSLERSIMVEVSGTAKNPLTEGVASFHLLLRPAATYRQSWKLRPLLEFGPAVHTVVQGASLEGLNRTRFKARVYAKTHGYAGFEALITNRLGLLVRGRVSIPSHSPFDYAQAAIFLR